jgi:hypothetical protein
MTRLPTLLFFLSTTGLMAQQTAPQGTWCLTDPLTSEYLLEQGLDPNSRPQVAEEEILFRGGGDPVIPVVFHIVWNTPQDNIPNSTIQMMLDQMNSDFSATNPELASVRAAFTSSIGNAGIQFCLAQFDADGNPASGIVRVQTTATWFSPSSQPHAMKQPPLGSSAWDPQRYLNIWVCDIVGTSGNIVSGYSYLPIGGMAGSWQDGLVIDAYYGTTAAARTATHEAGHYFGLRHTFDGNSCFSDDGMADTPNTDSPSWNCNFTNLQRCGLLTQYENFMDYSTCLSMYTNQQASYMQQILFGIRTSLLGSIGCSGISTGLQEQSTGALNLFPNPATDMVTLNTSLYRPGTATIKDMQGRVVLRVRLSGTSSTIPIKDLSPGPYLVEIETPLGPIGTRLLVE